MPASPVRATRARRAAETIAIAIPVLLAAWIALNLGGPELNVAVNDVVEGLAAFAAAAVCAWTGIRLATVSRSGWLILAGACASWGIGQVVWTWYEAVLATDVPSPGLADIGFLLFVPLAAVGLALIARPALRSVGAARVTLDGALVALSLLIITWTLLLADLVANAPENRLELAVDAAYPLGDMLLVTVVFSLWPRLRGTERRGVILLGAGIVAFAVADTTYAILDAQGTYGYGTFLDAGWVAGFMLIALAALRPPGRPAPARPDEQPTALAYLVPLLPLLPTLAAGIAFTLARGNQISTLLVWLFSLWIVLLFVRQALLMADTLALSRLQAQEREVERLRELDRFKTTLLNTAAHELRTPLAPARLLAQSLRRRLDDRLGAEDKAAFAVLERNLALFKRLADDLLDAARMQAGKLGVRQESVDLAVLARDVAAGFTQTASERGIAFAIDIPATTASMEGDPERLAQILSNLLDNAMKFTQKGGHVRFTLRQQGPSLFLTVQDDGQGIGPDMAARLFQPFVQEERTSVPGNRGSGLGLYITRQLVAAHGGELTGSSPGPGKGSSFTVRLPGSTSLTHVTA